MGRELTPQLSLLGWWDVLGPCESQQQPLQEGVGKL